MSALGNYVVAISLDGSQFSKGVSKTEKDTLHLAAMTQSSMDKMERSVQSFIGRVAGIGAAYLSVSSAFSSFNKQVDALAELDDAAQKTGASVELLSKLQKTANAFGTDFANQVEPAITKLSRGIAGLEDPSNKANAALAALDIKSRDANGNLRDSAQITIDVAKALQNYRDDASKAALVTDLFGKSGAELLPFLNDAAGSVDKFSGASAGAAANAAALQDSLNAQKQRWDEFTQQLTIAVLPAITDVAGAFLDVQTKGQSLSNDKAVTGWADNLALSVAPLYDTLANLKNEIYAVGKSFQVVYADIEVATARMKTFNPAAYVTGDPLSDLSKAQKNRQRVLIEANNAYADMANRPRDEYEQALRKRMSERPNQYASPIVAGSGSNKPAVGYVSGQSAADASDAKKAASDAAAAQKAYASLTDSINKQIEAKRAEYSVNGPLTESQKIMLDVNLKRADGQLKLTDAQYKNVQALTASLDAETRNAEMAALRLKSEQDYLALVESANAARDEQVLAAQDETKALEDQAQAKLDEIDQLSMTRDQLEALQKARYDERIGVLETQKAYLESQPDREYEIELIQRQIDALGVLRNSVGKSEAINKAKEDVNTIFGSMEQTARLAWTVFANSGTNAAQAVGKAIKASILDLLYQLTIKKFFVNIAAGTSGSAVSGAAINNILPAQNQSVFGKISEGFASINTTFSTSIEKLGAWLANGEGGLADKIGGFMGQYSNQISSGISYLGAAYMASQGNLVGGALTAAGTYFLGPIGGAIGGAIGSMFGGGKKIPRYSSQSVTQYNGGDYKTTSGTPMYKALGATKQTTGLNETFFNVLQPLFESLGVESELGSATTRLVQKRKASYGEFWATINGQQIGAGVQGSAEDTKKTFERLINKTLSSGISKAVLASSVDDGIKQLFTGLTKNKDVVSNMVTTTIMLSDSQDALLERYNLTLDTAGKVAKASGLADDALASFAQSLAQTALSTQKTSVSLLTEKGKLNDAIGSMPSSLEAFDKMLKSIDTSTAAGQSQFADLFGLRSRFGTYQSAMDSVTAGVNSSIYDLLSPSEQLAKDNETLAKLFGELNINVPGTIDELIKLGQSIDYTTQTGLDLALAFPTLVQAFQDTKGKVDALTGSLKEMSGFTSLADYRFYKGVANNYGGTVANDYARVMGVLGVSSSGKSTVNGADVDLLAELKAIRKASEQQYSELNKIVKLGLKVQA